MPPDAAAAPGPAAPGTPEEHMPAYAIADTLLYLDGVTVSFDGFKALNNLSLVVTEGELRTIIGPNGAGKTTVFNCLTGFYKPTEGRLALRRDGKEYLLERLEGHEAARKAGIARTFQNIRLFARMSVLENLLVAQHNMLLRASGFTVLGLIGWPGYRKAEAEAIDLARYWLDKVRLLERADVDAGGLPYGGQRRLEIARAMCTRPRLLCLDEPAAGLNPRETAELNELISSIRDDHKIGVLLIEHDMSVVMKISDHVVVLDYGRKIADGPPEQIRNDPAVIRAYLGEEETDELPEEVAADLAADRSEQKAGHG